MSPCRLVLLSHRRVAAAAQSACVAVRACAQVAATMAATTVPAAVSSAAIAAVAAAANAPPPPAVSSEGPIGEPRKFTALPLKKADEDTVGDRAFASARTHSLRANLLRRVLSS